ncbi:MAG TPA: AMP-binding protein [Rhodanobacteraceae bacterium]|nr:AMP-binding protein [Rhodanobacteraceae bacterium]
MTDPRPWLKSYPPGVPTEIDLGKCESIITMFDEACARYPQRPAYSSFGKSITYAELDRQSAAFSAFLANEWRLGKGDRLAIMMPNLLQYPIAMFGALRAGLTIVNVNPLYTARELEHQLADSGAKTIVVLENFAATLAEALPKTPIEHVVVTSIGDMLGFPKGALISFAVKHIKKMVPAWSLPGHLCFGDLLRRGAGMQRPKVQVGQDDIAFLQYTGGTTGVAKGAMLSHGNMVANTLQLAAWVGDLFTGGEEKIITALPLYHIFSLTVNALFMTYFGGENILITNPRDIPAFVKTLKHNRWTAITGVNTLYNALLNHPGFASVDFSRVKFALAGGMAVQRAVAERWKQATGIPLIEGYGLSEASPVATANRLDIKDYTGSIGLPLPSTDIQLRDDAGNLVPPGQPGEICVHGPQVMQGYWNRPEETAKVLDANRWVSTGDIARMDDKGFLYIVDRKKDMILVSGFNVYPNEIEDVVARHPGVLEVAAIGVPDEHSGEVVKLFVVKKDPALTEAALRQYCHDELTGYKRPKYIEFRKELPKSNVGKILRRALRDEERKKSPPGA